MSDSVPGQVYVSFGDTVTHEMPFSEVCMHMRVAGTVRTFRVIESASGYAMAQLLNGDGTPFSAPITAGEAGLYRDGSGRYYRYAS